MSVRRAAARRLFLAAGRRRVEALLVQEQAPDTLAAAWADLSLEVANLYAALAYAICPDPWSAE